MNFSEKKYNKAVILGAAGFLGINLTNALSKAGFDVTCFDQVSSSHWPEDVKTILGDFVHPSTELIAELNDAYVFHLVSSCRPSTNTLSAAKEVSLDLVTTINYLEQTKDHAIQWIFLSSGGTVYGQKDAECINESSPTEPICSYGLVKLSIERYFELYKRLHKTSYVTIRLGNPYGPWQDPNKGQGIVATLVNKTITNQKIEIWGDGSNVRDYIYIDDAIAGIMNAAFHGTSGEIYNVGTGQGTSIIGLIETIRLSLNLDVTVSHVDARAVDVRSNILDSSKLQLQANWQIVFDLQDGLQKTAEWIKLTLPH
ncbi:UDP-glucose 4-epimerase [Undibacterium sp. GrIS 1.8]|uniref:NAD-dependent epimerase/dehydratase family protein n=1 Tax=unclassified Undibacterium TaxID=2630295 RepID=UPI003394E272